MKLLRRTWADVNLDHLEHNIHSVRSCVAPGTRIMGIMKADAYGQGAVPLSHAMVDMGVEYLAVSNLEEAVQLRRGEIRAPLLILGYTPPSYAEMMIFMDIDQEVHSLEYARALNEQLKNSNYILNVHLKLDTGMTRLGFSDTGSALAACLEEIAGMRHLRVTGMFTHFSTADSTAPADMAFTALQYARFQDALALAESVGIRPVLRHACNSGAALLHPEYALDMIRPGILLYGVHPSRDTWDRLALQPVMTLRTMVAQLRRVSAGTPVSYGRTFLAERDMTLAVLPIGYADGLSRRLSDRGEFLLHGQRVSIVGRVCMDMCMVDVTDVPQTQVGDTVTVFGSQEGATIGCEELAEKTDTIAYEVLCGINKRIPRIYLSGGKESQILQYIV